MNRRVLVALAAFTAVGLVGPVTQSGVASEMGEKDTKSSEAIHEKPLFEADDGPAALPEVEAVAARITELSTPADENRRPRDGVPPQLAKGIVGFVGSPEGFTLVAGRGESPEELRETVSAGLSSTAADHLSTTVADRSTAELTKVWRDVRAYDWVSRNAYSLDVDAKTARVELLISGVASDADLKALRALGGEALEIEFGNFSRTSRTNDPAPHWGGASISSSSGTCSSGFTVAGKTTGTKYSLTAGHCGSNGTQFYSTVFFGEMAGKAGYPDYDQARLKNSTYANRIYTDGQDNFTTRLVTGANDGSTSNPVCLSGKTSKSICSITIQTLSTTYCDPEGDCSTYVARGKKTGVTVARPGDSGGPVYLRNTSEARANVKGIIIAGGYEYVWWERYNSISNHLNVTVVASP